jgi:hypothetical protein
MPALPAKTANLHNPHPSPPTLPIPDPLKDLLKTFIKYKDYNQCYWLYWVLEVGLVFGRLFVGITCDGCF